MKPRLVVAFVVTTIAVSSLAFSQTPDSLLPGLSWVPGSWDSSLAARSIVQTNTPSFIIGWNWVAPYSPIGRMTHGTLFHVNDALDRTGNQLSGLQRTMRDSYVAGTRLIPCINGVSADVNIDGHPVAAQLGNPGAAIGIEYAPWLDFNHTTNDVILVPDDSSRSIAGFRTRALGNRVGLGTRADPYRLHLARSTQNHAAPTLALDRPTLDTVMMWKAEDHSSGTYMAPGIQLVGSQQILIFPLFH